MLVSLALITILSQVVNILQFSARNTTLVSASSWSTQDCIYRYGCQEVQVNVHPKGPSQNFHPQNNICLVVWGSSEVWPLRWQLYIPGFNYTPKTMGKSWPSISGCTFNWQFIVSVKGNILSFKMFPFVMYGVDKHICQILECVTFLRFLECNN